MARFERLAQLPIDKRRGANTSITIGKVTTADGTGDAVIVALGPDVDTADTKNLRDHDEPLAIVIGRGPTKTAALADAQSTLQAALDSVDVAILKASRS